MSKWGTIGLQLQTQDQMLLASKPAAAQMACTGNACALIGPIRAAQAEINMRVILICDPACLVMDLDEMLLK